MRIGVTGNYASGKSTVCSFFAALGGKVIDTDVLARDVVQPGSAALSEIAEVFGAEMIREDGSLDRGMLADTVFPSREKVGLLNSIMHPKILELVLRQSEGDEYYFINTPLLFESGFDSYMDYNIAVFSDRVIAAERGVKRDGLTPEQIKLRTENQFSFNIISKKADFIIDNNSDLERTQEQVIRLWKIIQTHRLRD